MINSFFHLCQASGLSTNCETIVVGTIVLICTGVAKPKSITELKALCSRPDKLRSVSKEVIADILMSIEQDESEED